MPGFADGSRSCRLCRRGKLKCGMQSNPDLHSLWQSTNTISDQTRLSCSRCKTASLICEGYESGLRTMQYCAPGDNLAAKTQPCVAPHLAERLQATLCPPPLRADQHEQLPISSLMSEGTTITRPSSGMGGKRLPDKIGPKDHDPVMGTYTAFSPLIK